MTQARAVLVLLAGLPCTLAAQLGSGCAGGNLLSQALPNEVDHELRQAATSLQYAFDRELIHQPVQGVAESQERFVGPHVWLANATVRRAAQVYSGDVSRLRDVCRHRLFFDSPAQMEACVQCVRADAGVRGSTLGLARL